MLLFELILIIILLTLPTINSFLYKNNCCGYYLPGTRWNMGIDPFTGLPENGNVGWGNNIAAFFITCKTCNRSG